MSSIMVKCNLVVSQVNSRRYFFLKSALQTRKLVVANFFIVSGYELQNFKFLAYQEVP